MGSLARLDQEVKVRHHEKIAEDFEAQAHAQLNQRLHKMRSKAIPIENPPPAVGAGDETMRVIVTVLVALPRHTRVGKSTTGGRTHTT